MTGTASGGKKCAATNKKLYGEDYYSRIGKKGGSVSTPTGGFGSEKVGPDGLTGRQRSVICGRIGGRKSKRGKKVQND